MLNSRVGGGDLPWASTVRAEHALLLGVCQGVREKRSMIISFSGSTYAAVVGLPSSDVSSLLLQVLTGYLRTTHQEGPTTTK